MMNMSRSEASNPLKLKQEKILAFSSVLPIPIVHTVSTKSYNERSLERGPPAKRSRRSPTGVERVTQTARRRSTFPPSKEKIRRNKGRLPPGKEVTRSVSVLSFENGFFFQASRSSKQNKVSQWDYLWVERSLGKRGS